jgi:uncharacterized protein (TIGR03083 family)
MAADAPPPASDLALDSVLNALRDSRRQLCEVTSGLAGDALRAPSFDSEWSIAQVLSHLGSGAEIFGLILDAGLRGGAAPGLDACQAVWDRWDALSPDRQAADGLASDGAFLERLDAVAPADRDRWRLDLFGDDQTLPSLARMRLSEHALHTWDIAVTADDQAVLSPSAVPLLLDALPALVARVGRPSAEAQRVAVSTTAPDRSFALELGPDGARLEPDGLGSGDSALELSSEALIRLVCGRLDGPHTPSVDAHGLDLDMLRRVFPGL